MGLFTINIDEIKNQIQQEFKENMQYLVAIKHHTNSESILKSIVSVFYRNVDATREYILVFNQQGIYEKELGFSDSQPFLLIPWNEVNKMDVYEKSSQSILIIDHLGKEYRYEIPYTGRIMINNKNHLMNLQALDFYNPNK